MNKLRQYFSTRKTAQNLPIPGRGQVENSAGGYAWTLDKWGQLDRFLILGSEGGTYYIQPQKLTVDNAENVINCIQEDGSRVVGRVVEISLTGRAPKNDPALFVLAMVAGLGDEASRRVALDALPKVARIGTHLFHFLEYVEGFRGWGRGLRRGVANWYTQLPAERLAYQAVKYQQRDGWSHRDALRLAHPKAPSPEHDALFAWITQGMEWPDADVPAEKALQMIWAFEQAKEATSVGEIQSLIAEYGLPWEAVPSEWHGQADIWRTLLPALPLGALLRNLGRLTASGVLVPMSDEVALVVEKLTNPSLLQKARIHPIGVLSALMTYKNGRGLRGKLAWTPVPQIVDALDAAFYNAFQAVQPTGKRHVLALDVSGSMGVGMVANTLGLTPRIASAAMSLLTAVSEPQMTTVGFSHQLIPLNISPRQRLDDVVKAISGIPFGATDCAQPMLWAMERNIKADVFIVYTDNETWYGKIHPAQALQAYRDKMGINAKLIVVGMVANRFSIADPEDAGMLDVVGFDTAVPRLMSDFIGG